MADDAAKSGAATKISYCPALRIYHYWRIDGTEAFFSQERLEQSIDAYIRDGKPADAEFMAFLTGLARRYPHREVVFDSEGKCTVGEVEKEVDGGGATPTDG